MNLYVVSDLHIWGSEDPLYFSLLSLLRDRAVAGDTVVLAGDLFDLFVGNKPVFTQRYSDFVKEMAKAAGRGVVIHYIEGNHDFLMRQVFEGVSGVMIHPCEVSVELQGKHFYFAHGDTVNPRDYSY